MFDPVAENIKYIQTLLNKPGQDFRSERLTCPFVPHNTIYDCEPQIRIQIQGSSGIVTVTEAVPSDVQKLSDGPMLGGKYFLYVKNGFRYGEPSIMIKISELRRTCTFPLTIMDTAASRVDDTLGLHLVFRSKGAECHETLRARLFIEPGDSLRQEIWDFMEYHAPDRFVPLSEADLKPCEPLLNYAVTYRASSLSLYPANTSGERKKILRSLKTIYKYVSKGENGSGD
ncbi:MAG: hypothetical protein NZM65_05815, partial [Flavobacteriales bacterium]|nr:hypothetical protein [Flavobacteriales bacterium]MDW8410190.1 hypothetical protein [Flavobacteriales bacterium]